MQANEKGEWNNQFISKKKIYNILREISSNYGECHSVDKQSAVLRCIDAIMMIETITIGRCEECAMLKYTEENEPYCKSPYGLSETDETNFCGNFIPKEEKNET